MILVDTSVWTDFFAGRDLPYVATLEQLILENEDLNIPSHVERSKAISTRTSTRAECHHQLPTVLDTLGIDNPCGCRTCP